MMTNAWMWSAVLSAALAADDKKADLPSTSQPLAHMLEVEGLPEGMALVVAHDTSFIHHLTVVPDNGRHSLQSWDRVPGFGSAGVTEAVLDTVDSRRLRCIRRKASTSGAL